jgi:hypothetical protein
MSRASARSRGTLGDGLMIASLPDEAIDPLVSTAGTSAKFPQASVEVRDLARVGILHLWRAPHRVR